ncbi:MAG TPA: M23 family metallopeptidase [Candidatus Dormibacteraeota bacterium]|nr:M23 family metallopeptidase [Candidatus Dormibacteraeota bacterium]
MTVVLRIVLLGSAVGLAWMFAASQLVDQARLPLDAIVEGAVLTQPFGCTTLELEPFDPLCPSRHVHTGVDLAAPAGTLVHSATSGVARVGYDAAGAGLYVAVSVGGDVRILYCHLFSTAVNSGEQVVAGQVIGTIGSSGLATGPHLHFEVQVDGRPVDPALWLAAGP